jgi:hypothetical protein
LTAGPKGPILLQDTNFIEHLAHFDRERIPERVVHAKGAGAFGYFECTSDAAAKYSKVAPFAFKGKRTELAVRFSTVGGESGSADTARDPRGFAVKFYTEDGNWEQYANLLYPGSHPFSLVHPHAKKESSNQLEGSGHVLGLYLSSAGEYTSSVFPVWGSRNAGRV